MFYTTEASACFIQLLFIPLFFFSIPFQTIVTIHKSIKQTHFPIIKFRCVAGKKANHRPWPGLTSSHTHAMIKVFDLKVFDLSSFHQFMGKPLTLRYAAYVSAWPGCDLSSTLQLIVRVRVTAWTYYINKSMVTVTPWIDLMVLFVTNKPLIELICLKNDGVNLKLYQIKRNWQTYFMYFGNYKKQNQKKKKM